MNVPAVRFPEFEENWEVKRLGAIAPNPSYGLNAAAAPFDGVHKYIRITDIDEETRQFTAVPVTSPDGEIGADYKLEIGDLLLARTGASTGKSYLYKQEDGNVYFAGFLIRFRIKHADASFVFAQTLRRAFDLWIIKMSMRSGQPGVNAKEFASLTFATPSLPEQKKIAAFLGVVDAKIAALRARVAGLERYKRGLMQALFSQTLRFTKEDGTAFPDWEEKRLGEVAKVVTGKTPSTTNDSLWNGDTMFVTPSDIKDGSKYQPSTVRMVWTDPSTKLVPQGAILYTCIASVGKMAIATEPCITNQQINAVVPKSNSEFVYYSLLWLTPRIKLLSANTTVPIINKTEFSLVKLHIPHPDEQARIAEALSVMDAKIAAVTGQLERMQDFKKGLLQQMFV